MTDPGRCEAYAWYNRGSQDDQALENAALWGLAADVSLTPTLNLLGESYGTDRGDTELQLGLRMALAGGFADLSYGWTRSSSSDDWITFGLAWMF